MGKYIFAIYRADIKEIIGCFSSLKKLQEGFYQYYGDYAELKPNEDLIVYKLQANATYRKGMTDGAEKIEM